MNQTKRLLLSFITSALLFPAGSASAADAVLEAQGMGTVDMTKARNKVQARLMAKRAAIADAQRNLLEAMEGVRITSGTTVKDAQLESDVIANRVKGLLKGAFVVSQNVIEEDGEVLAEATLGICLDASLAECKARPTLSAVVLDEIRAKSTEPLFEPESAASAAVPAPAAAGTQPPTVREPGETYTGLIIETSFSDYDPGFDMRLTADDGTLVYGPRLLNDNIDSWGKVAADLASAREQTDLVGEKPLIISATASDMGDGLQVSRHSALGVYEANLASGNFLGQGRVIVVTGAQ
ncbi:MAG: hypothetical protein KDI36_14465 [Pseudomonadales bacterium]|nr:hypothetical protein [Pseudomonadales bacterium]